MTRRFPPDDPREWLNRARSSLAQAKTRTEGVYLEDLCFCAQQAAEKALKGFLLFRRVRFPYVHDLAELLARFEEAGEEIPAELRKAARLSDYAVEARYPSPDKPVSEEEYAEAVALAEEVVRWVEARLS